MRTLALDYGERRVGVAVTDPTGRTALPLETIDRRARGPLLDELARIIDEYEVVRIVVGLPLELDGRSGPQAERTRRFGAALAQHTRLPIEYLDERWTSREAERALEPAGRSPKRQKKRRERIDTAAATILLRTWLDRETP